MLEPTDLQTLTAWCKRRAMRWLVLRAGAGLTVLLLEPVLPTRPWQRMHLVVEDHVLRLEAEAGETLASASDLPAVLDALDGGVADMVPRLGTPAPPGEGDRVSVFA